MVKLAGGIAIRRERGVCTYLLVKHDKGWLEEIHLILAGVIWILLLTKTLIHRSLVYQEVGIDLPWEMMERDDDVLSVSDVL